MAEKTGSDESLQRAYEEAAGDMLVTEVLSVWAPTVTRDEELAEAIADELIVNARITNPDITGDELQRLKEFGVMVGTLSMRKLFEPFVSDAVVVTYTDDSGLDQADAVRRVTNGLNVDATAIVG